MIHDCVLEANPDTILSDCSNDSIQPFGKSNAWSVSHSQA
jgi:hypothetical protein